jgi:hypothetical protein
MFNAIKYSKELEEAGFSRNQAEATINAFYKFMDNNFATKSDIDKGLLLTRTELREDMSKLRFELRGEMAALRDNLCGETSDLRKSFETFEYRMTIKFGVMQAASVAILAALIKLI